MRLLFAIKDLIYRLLELAGIIHRGEIPPWGYVESTYVLIKHARSKYPAKKLINQGIHGPHIIKRELPKQVNSNMQEQFTRNSMLYFESPDTFVASIQSGRVFTKDGIVITPDNHLLWDVSKNFFELPSNHIIFQKKTSKVYL